MGALEEHTRPMHGHRAVQQTHNCDRDGGCNGLYVSYTCICLCADTLRHMGGSSLLTCQVCSCQAATSSGNNINKRHVTAVQQRLGMIYSACIDHYLAKAVHC